VSEIVTGVNGRALSKRGVETRRRLLEAAEHVFGELGYYDASIVKITEEAGVAQGTFYLYFASKKDIFDELVRDLNGRIRRATREAAAKGRTRLESELLGFRGYFAFTSEHPELYSIIRQAGFVSPEIFRYHYERIWAGYQRALRRAVADGEAGEIDPEVTAWVLMAISEAVGMRWIVWGDGQIPRKVEAELTRIVARLLESPE